MSDVGFALEAKSDQLNTTDLVGYEPVITITEVRVNKGDQPVWVYYHGCNNRPWKVSKGMIRILAAGWGRDSNNWIGKSVQIFNEPTVKYAGKEVGGVRIRAMSDIPTSGLKCIITINRQQRQPYPVKFLSMERPTYPADKFNQQLPAMENAIESGKMTIQQVISRCQQTGDLTKEQIEALERAVPVSADDADSE